MWRFCLKVCSGFQALEDMESVVLSVVRQRREGGSQEVFLDTLLQANLTERQVTFTLTQSLISLPQGDTTDRSFCGQVMEDCMVFTLAGCSITANCRSPPTPTPHQSMI